MTWMEEPECNLLLASNKWLIKIENDPISDFPSKKAFYRELHLGNSLEYTNRVHLCSEAHVCF